MKKKIEKMEGSKIMSINMTEEETIIYNIIQEYVKSNKPVEINELASYIVSINSIKSINLNSKGIKKIIETLLNKNLIVEGSRLIKDDLMENERRKSIYKYICNNPAVYHHQIIKDLDIPNHIAVWHLNVLLDFNLIKKIRIDNHDTFYESKRSPYDARMSYYTRHEKCKEIIHYLKGKIEGCSKTQLSNELGMHPNTVKKFIDELDNLQIVYKKSEMNKTLYYLFKPE